MAVLSLACQQNVLWLDVKVSYTRSVVKLAQRLQRHNACLKTGLLVRRIVSRNVSDCTSIRGAAVTIILASV